MIEFDSVAGRNIVVYDEFKLDFKHPFAVLRGPNRSGKTIIPACIGNLLYGTALTDDSRGSGARIHDKGSLIQLSGGFGNHRWEFKQLSKGKGLAYEAVIDGVKQTVRGGGANTVREMIAEHVPITEDLFYSTVMLSALRHNVLHTGGTTGRKAYFEAVYDQGIYDAIHDRLSQRAVKLRGDRTRLEMMKERHAELKGRRINIEEARQREVKLRGRVDAMGRKLEAMSQHITDLSSWLTLAEGLTHPDRDVDALSRAVTGLEKRVIAGRRLLESMAANSERVRAYERNQEARLRIAADLRKLGVKPDPNQISRLDRWGRVTAETAEDLRTRAEAAQALQADIDQWRVITNEMGMLCKMHGTAIRDELHAAYTSGTSWEEQERVIGARESSIRNTMASLRAIQSKHLKECPACGQSLHDKHIPRVLAGMDADLVLVEIKQEFMRLLRAYTEYRDAINGQTPEDSEALTRAAERGERENAALLAQRRRVEQAIRLHEKMSSIPEVEPPPPVPGDFDPEELRSKVEMAERQLADVRQDLRLRERLAQMQDFGDPTAARERLKRTSEARNRGSSDLRTLNDDLHRLSSSIAAGSMVEQELNDLERRTGDAEQRLADLPVYDALLAAYGARGLRILALRNIAAMFEANLNTYADLLFTEPFKFRINVEESRFDILAERNGRISEIAGSLSGSETRCFQLICLPSMLPFIPAQRRANLCILDEMEANMDRLSRPLYASQFIPALTSIIPRVLVVTPLEAQEMHLPGAVEYRVAKKGGRSTLLLPKEK